MSEEVKLGTLRYIPASLVELQLIEMSTTGKALIASKSEAEVRGILAEEERKQVFQEDYAQIARHLKFEICENWDFSL